MKKTYSILIMVFILSVLILFSIPNPIFAVAWDEVYVNSITGNDLWNGRSPIWDGTNGPKATIADALGYVANLGTIYVASGGTYSPRLNIPLTGKTISIVGTGSAKPVINGGVTVYHEGVGSETDVLILRNLTIINGDTSSGGGISSSISRLEIYNCDIFDNHASSSGGGINCTNTVIIDGCNISNNRAASGYLGGGIAYYGSGSLTITNSIISNNSAGDLAPGPFAQGGGIYFSGGELIIHNSSIVNNKIYNSGSVSYNGIYLASTMNVTQNWWGSSTGPFNETFNPGGTGNSILGIGFDYEDFYPWLTSDPFAGTAGEPVWVRTMPMTCYRVWVNEDGNFQFLFWYPYRDNNWVRIYDMTGKMVYEFDMPYDNPNLIVDLPDGTYTVKTFHDQPEPLQTFVIGKP